MPRALARTVPIVVQMIYLNRVLVFADRRRGHTSRTILISGSLMFERKNIPLFQRSPDHVRDRK